MRTTVAVNVVISAMQNYPDSAVVAVCGCGVLWKFAMEDENVVDIVSAGGIDVIFSALGTHPTNVIVAEKGCGALFSIATPDGAHMIVNAVGFGTLFATIRSHLGSAIVAESGCALLKDIAFESASSRAILIEAGSIEIVLSVMKLHPTNADVLEKGCGALRNMWCILWNERNHSIIAAIGAILSAMRAHPNQIGVIAQGCGALDNMSVDNADNGAIIKKAGGKEVLNAALRLHPANAYICLWANAVLKRLPWF